jgi:hypothetical protein
MKAIGLYPSNTGAPGGRETGHQMQHYIVSGGRFAEVFAALAATGWRLDLESAERPGKRGKVARIGVASRAPAATVAMGERRRSAAHTMRTKNTLSSIPSRSMARATSRGAMIRAFVLATAGS